MHSRSSHVPARLHKIERLGTHVQGCVLRSYVPAPPHEAQGPYSRSQSIHAHALIWRSTLIRYRVNPSTRHMTQLHKAHGLLLTRAYASFSSPHITTPHSRFAYTHSDSQGTEMASLLLSYLTIVLCKLRMYCGPWLYGARTGGLCATVPSTRGGALCTPVRGLHGARTGSFCDCP